MGHFIQSTLHLKGHYISQCTSSHKSLHLTTHFISYITSSYRSLHPTGHFIPYVTSYYESFNPASHFIPVNTSCLILFFHFIPPTIFTPPFYISLHPGYHSISITSSFSKLLSLLHWLCCIGVKSIADDP